MLVKIKDLESMVQVIFLGLHLVRLTIWKVSGGFNVFKKNTWGRNVEKKLHDVSQR